MADMLSFISNIIKETDGLSMRQLVQQSGMTRSMFYRFMQEPQRFSDAQLELISEILKLGDSDRKTLFQFKEGITSDSGQELNNAIHQLLFNSWPLETDTYTKAYTLFNSLPGHERVTKLSAEELVNGFVDWIAGHSADDNNHFLTIKLINCHTREKIKLIYSILSLISNTDYFSNYGFEIQQAVNSAQMSLADKFKTIYSLNSMFGLVNYYVDFVTMPDGAWQYTDCCFVEYSYRNEVRLYMVATFPSNEEALLFVTNNRMPFDFASYGCKSLFKHEEENYHFSDEPIALNRFLTESMLKSKKLLIDHELCYDCFCGELWQEVQGIVKQSPDIIHNIRGFADPKGAWMVYSDDQFVDLLFESCIQRYYVSEAVSAINVVFPISLKDFALIGGISDFKYLGLRFSNQQIIKQLKNIKDRIGDHTNEHKQSYYIVNPTYRTSYPVICTFRDSYFFYSSANTSGLEMYIDSIPQPDMATALYDYVVQELLPSTKRTGFESPFMSDERAVAFIDSLIEEVEQRGVE